MTFFFALILHEILLRFFYDPLGGFALSLFSNWNRPIPFSWALPHQGQLILCKTGPKIRKLGRLRGGGHGSEHDRGGLLLQIFKAMGRSSLDPAVH